MRNQFKLKYRRSMLNHLAPYTATGIKMWLNAEDITAKKQVIMDRFHELHFIITKVIK